MIFNRGMALSEIVLDGKRAIRVYLDGQILWDGTRNVTHMVPSMLGSGTFTLPLITAESPVHVDIMTGSASMRPPVIRGASAPAVERMVGSGKLFGPVMHATATVTGIEMFTAYGVFISPQVSEAFDRSVSVPPMVAVGTFMLPAVAAEYVAQVQRMAGSGAMSVPLITATSTGAVSPPRMSGQGLVLKPGVTASSKPAVTRLAGTGAMNAPAIKRTAAPAISMMTGSGLFRVPSVQAINFKPTGMIKSANSNITSTTAAVVTGMAANANLPGTTVTTDSVISAFAGPVRAGFSIQLSSSGGTTGYAAVFKNGVQVGDTFSMTVPYNGASLITGSAAFTVAVGDSISLRYWSESTSYPVSVKATTTRLNVSAGDTVALGGTVSANYTPGDGWTDMPIVADSGTTLSGYGIVVPATHPNAIVTAAAVISSGSAMGLRFLVNGTVVHTGPTAPAYDVRMVAATGLALAAGDVVKCQVQRISTFATTVSAGATLKIV